VTGVYVYGRTTYFFPKGLDKIFKNLEMINIWNCQLKEIHQSDLKVFPNLVYFALSRNEIKWIEAGLFDFNPNLEYVGFHESSIIHIDPNVFDHLNELRYFQFWSVPCFNQDINDSIEKVQEALQVIKSNCSNSKILALDRQIKKLEIESKNLSSEAFNIKLESFEKRFNNSKFSEYPTLNSKFQNLKLVDVSTQIDQVPNASILNQNEINLKNITDKSEDLKSSQYCPVDDHKASQNELPTTLSEIKSLVTEHGSNLDNLKASYDQISKTLTDLKTDMDTKLKLLKNLMEKIDEKL